MPDSGGLQLIPDTKRKIEIHRPGQNKILYIGGFILLIFLGIGFAVSWYKSSINAKIEALDLQIGQLETESLSLREEKQKLKVLASQLSVSSQLIRDHLMWSKGLALLEDQVRTDIQFVSMAMAIVDKKINVKGKATSYSTVARQIASLFREPSISDVAVSKISSSGDGRLEFEMVVTFNDRGFLKEDVTTAVQTDAN